MMAPPENFELWSRYEDLAMHFNGLIIQFRTQALAGLAALSSVAGYLIEKIPDTRERERYRLIAGCSAAFAVAWTAAACLDLLYYSRLLEGAVKAIIDLERDTKIQLSTSIRREVGSYWPAWVFYALIFF